MRIPVLYRDADIIVIDKPVGMPTTASPGDPYPGDAVRALGAQLGLAGLTTPQRLPVELSGVLVLVVRPEIAPALADSFGASDVEHAYLALVHGRPSPASGTIDAPLARVAGEAAERYVVTNARDKRAQRAVSHYRLLETTPDGRYSLLEVMDGPAGKGAAGSAPAHPPQPAVTAANERPRASAGRLHSHLQVRAHLAHLGLPVVGDPLYGGGAEVRTGAQAGAARPGALSAAAPGDRRARSPVRGKGTARGKASAPARGVRSAAESESRGAQPGPFAPRLGLHLARLTLAHPGSGQRMTFSAPPPAFMQGLGNGLPELKLAAAGRAIGSISRRAQPESTGPAGLERLIELALARRAPLAADPATTIYRLINGTADGLTGLAVDRYGTGLVVNVYDEGGATPGGAPAPGGAASPGSAPRRASLADASAGRLAPVVLDLLVQATGAAAVYVKYRQREASRVEDEDLPELAPAAPVAGRAVGEGATAAAAPEEAAPGEYVAREDGLAYLVRPGEGWNPGLFPDMREMRGRVRAWAAGRRVLNTFAYTCGFGVAARVGGAARVVNLDVSRPLLERGRANYRANGLRPEPEDFLYGDTFDWLPRLKARHELFDLIILDPPGFARTKTHIFSAARDYGKLAGAAAGVLAPGGLLVACCNVADLSWDRFQDRLIGGLDDAWRAAEVVGRYGAPALDFPGLPGREGYLKILVARLA